jgi:hypothetical protein
MMALNIKQLINELEKVENKYLELKILTAEYRLQNLQEVKRYSGHIKLICEKESK